ncbi:MAG: Dioxygenases related to 2-nitropropane dioxygenase [Erysipelotrichaceae bacterium]|nr:MAG: Dioxygenase related to 2-nitropropane [Erysipelotrichaceae bacterium]TXT17944.1 MAG: Dioxygenases related to 2-nitropropane dioxygenase [Erysipelotrichaceae bacterium]
MLLNEILGIKYPIVQGAMANIATAEFAAAVSNSGALGIIGTGGWPADVARAAILRCRELTDKPFGVNVMMMNPHTEAIFDVIAELKPALVTTGAGNPGQYIPKLKALGIIVVPIVPTVGLALRMQQAGADMVIIEGTEAGGHVGELTTMALVPQVVDALSIPVIAAGGIADGRGFNAALSLGAIGVQVGTCLLVAEECPVHQNYKDAIINAKDTDTVVTGRSVSAPVRIKKNLMSQKYIKLEKEGADREELEKLTLGSLRKAVFDGDMENGSVMMGQIAGMVKEIKPLAEIFESIIQDAQKQAVVLNSKLEVFK